MLKHLPVRAFLVLYTLCVTLITHPKLCWSLTAGASVWADAVSHAENNSG